MYIFREIHDSQLMLFLFFPPSAPLAASPSYTYLTCKLHHLYTILPDSAVLSTVYTFDAAFDFAMELKLIDSTRLRPHMRDRYGIMGTDGVGA